MSWELSYGGSDYDLVSVDVSKRVNQLNVANVSCVADIPIDSEVVLKKGGVVSFGGYVKKKKTENGVIFEYEIVELFCELNDQIVYEGLKEYNVSGQYVRFIVSDILAGTGWRVGSHGGHIGYLTQTTSDKIKIGDGNINLMTGGKKLDVGDCITFNQIPPTPFHWGVTYHVVYADDVYIKLSTVKNGSPIVAMSSVWYLSTGMVKVITYMSTYWAKKATAINKVVSEIGEMVWWTDATGKKLSFDYSRVNRGSIDDDVIMIEPEEDSFKRGYDKVIVLGKTDSIKGIAGSGTKVVVYKYEDCNNVDEAEALARTILNDLGKVSRRVNVTLAPGGMFNEADTVELDGVEYFVFDVTENYEEVKLGLGAMRSTIMDKLGDKLREVTGEVGTGVNGTFDGGLQNMGAPSVNCLVSVDTTTSTFAVSDVLDYYSNGDRVVVTSSGTVPNPLVEENVYYVVNINGTNDTFQVAATRGGNPITLMTNGSGLIRVRNLDSQSIPAEFVINVPDVEKIGNLQMTADFSAYRDQMSIGDEVEFLSVPSIIEETSTSQYLDQSTSPLYVPSSSGFALPIPDAGYQYGLAQFIMNPALEVDTDKTYDDDRYDWAIKFEISYDGGATWTPVISTNQGTHSLTAHIWIRGVDLSDRTIVCSMRYPVVNSCLIPGVATNKQAVKLRVVVYGGYSYSGPSYMHGTINCQIVPRHTHIIDKQNNVLKSTLAKNVKCYLTNVEFTEKLIYSWNGVVNGERVLTDIHEYLRNGQNILQFYSESPGSVYVTGTFESYSV